MSNKNEQLNEKELELFIKFNNQIERKNRHSDFYYLDDPNQTQDDIRDKQEYNYKQLVKDTAEQIRNDPEYFNSPNIKKILREMYQSYQPVDLNMELQLDLKTIFNLQYSEEETKLDKQLRNNKEEE